MHHPWLQSHSETSLQHTAAFGGEGVESGSKTNNAGRKKVTSREEPQPKLSPAIMMGYLVAMDPSSTGRTEERSSRR